MPKLFAIVDAPGRTPNVPQFNDAGQQMYVGYVICDYVGGYAAALFGGSTAMLTRLNALPQVWGIVAVTESGGVRWAELDGVISSAVRSKINGWLSVRGYPTIPVGWTYRQVVLAIFKRLNDRFSLDNFDVIE